MKAKAKAKAKNKAAAKGKSGCKKRPREGEGSHPEDGGDSFAAEFVDCLGRKRLTLFGDDLINAVNFTLERCNNKNIKRDAVQFAIDLGVIFAFTGKLEAIVPLTIAKANVWTKSRVQIKHYLNRVHTLQARHSDPDLPQASDLARPTDDNDEDEDGSPEQESSSLGELVSVVKAVSDKSMLSFLDDNFSKLIDSNAEVPTIAQAFENQPGMMRAANKMKRFVKAKCSIWFPFATPSGGEMPREIVSKEVLMTTLITEMVEIVNGIFDPGFMELIACLLRMHESIQGEDSEDTSPWASSIFGGCSLSTVDC